MKRNGIMLVIVLVLLVSSACGISKGSGSPTEPTSPFPKPDNTYAYATISAPPPEAVLQDDAIIDLSFKVSGPGGSSAKFRLVRDDGAVQNMQCWSNRKETPAVSNVKIRLSGGYYFWAKGHVINPELVAITFDQPGKMDELWAEHKDCDTDAAAQKGARIEVITFQVNWKVI